MLLNILDELMKARGINKSVLAKESGIPYTTIDGFYKKGYDNVKLSTLFKLCEYFDVSLDYLVRNKKSSPADNDGELSKTDKKILELFHLIPECKREEYLVLWETLLKTKGLL